MGATAFSLAACGSAGQAAIATSTPTPAMATESIPVSATTESPATATVVVTAAAAPPQVTVTAPPPVVTTVTQTEQPPVIVVPDPTTVFATDYHYGQYGSVEALPDGLYCRDLKAMGYSYSAAITYWNYRGQPSRMDLDLNGIPCETVY